MTSQGDREVLLVASAGGHLAQMKMLAPALESANRHWVTFADARHDVGSDEVIVCHSPTTRNIPNLIRNMILAVRVVAAQRPDVIVSTGAAVAVPFFLAGRAFGAKTVFVEVFDRVDSRTLTGRLVKPFADAFLLQWAEQREAYGGGDVIGPLYDLDASPSPSRSATTDIARESPRPASVFGTVGTDHHPFDRMVDWCDQLAAAAAHYEVFVQTGTSSEPRHAESAARLDVGAMGERLHQSDAVICHGGPSTILEAIAAGHMPIVIPRTAKHGEHVDDHQVRFCKLLAAQGRIALPSNAGELRAAVDRAVVAGRAPARPMAAAASTLDAFTAQLQSLYETPRRRLKLGHRR